MHQQKKRRRKHLVRGKVAADYLGSTDAELRAARWSGTGRFGTLPFYRVGRSVLYDLDEIDDWLDAHRVVRETTAGGMPASAA